MRIANVGGRLTLLGSDGGIDVERASQKRFGPDPQAVYAAWPAFRDWAAGVRATGDVVVRDADLGSPSPRPTQVFGIGLNYRDHAAETGAAVPKEPPVFPKWNNSILDPGEPILRPRGEKTLDWEVELGLVIGKTARFVSKEKALDYVYGYTIINDVSARDFQFHTSQWGPGKMGDTLAPVGPYIADRSEIPDPHALSLKAWVNGTLMQDGNTKNFIFDIGYIIQYLSNIMTLSPGDLISTGTPAGVGFSRKPQITLQPGDVCKLEITGLGAIENPVKDA